MKKNIIAMVLVGGRGKRLHAITKTTAKPAVNFGGKYRLIDFVLSNLSNSGITTIGLVTQYEPYELTSYVEHGSTWDLDVNDGGISFLTPYTSMEGEQWQKGTAHAIKQHFKFIDQYNPEYVLILPGDHVYKMDYNLMIKQHKDTKSEVTVAAFKVTGNPSRFGILETDESNKITSFEEKPENPKSDLGSMGIYVFNTSVLKSLLNDKTDQLFDFGQDIIPLALKKKLNVCAYNFSGYFKDVGTIESLYEANMDLIDNPHFLKIRDYDNFPLLAKSRNLPPHHIVSSDQIIDSFISDGCLIYGEIIHSILSSGILVNRGSVIKNSIIHPNVRIGTNCTIENAIITKDSIVLSDTSLVFDQVTVVDNEFLWKFGDDHE